MAPAKTLRPPLTLGQRRDLIEAHLYRVGIIASMLCRRLPQHVERAELISVGNLRLVECANRFDPKRGFSFSAFARLNIQGAMLDFLRSLDLLSRDERRKVNASPTAGTLRCRVPIDAAFGSGVWDDTESQLDVERLLSGLMRRERYIVEQYFLKGQTMAEVAVKVGVAESRISQIIKRAVETMRAEVHP